MKLERSSAGGGDYINASHISVSLDTINEPMRYIACQGPLEETVDDFWEMLWQEEVGVIGMLTQIVEGEKVKCQGYWPQVKGEALMLVDG